MVSYRQKLTIFRNRLAIQFSETDRRRGSQCFPSVSMACRRRGMLLIRDQVLVVNCDRIFFRSTSNRLPNHPIFLAFSGPLRVSFSPAPATTAILSLPRPGVATIGEFPTPLRRKP